MLKAIPHILTLSNLFFGCAAVVSLFTGNWNASVIFVFMSGVADFLDGLAARALHVAGELGKQLDSLADVVSFGLVPGLIAYILILRSLGIQYEPIQALHWQAMPGFLITLFSALRLGKFNIDTRQTHEFIGLNTPTNTFFFCGLLWLTADGYLSPVDTPIFWILLSVVMSLLLIAPIPMFNFKTTSLGFKGNEIRIFFLIGVVLFVIFLGKAALSLAVLYYILLSFIQFLFKNYKTTI